MGLISRVSSRTYRRKTPAMDRRINLQLPGPGSYNRNKSDSRLSVNQPKGFAGYGPSSSQASTVHTNSHQQNAIYLMMHGQRQQQQQKKVSAKVRMSKPVDTTITPCQTIYVNNLNENIKPKELKDALISVFKQFGPVIDIVAMKSVKRRGQAYISFSKVEEAEQAVQAMQGFPLFKKPLRIEFARKPSDKVAKQQGTYKPRPPRPPRPTRAQRKQMHVRRMAEKNRQEYEARMANPLTAPVKPVFQFADNSIPPPPPPDDHHAAASYAHHQHQMMPLPPPSTNSNSPPNNILFIERLPPESNELMISVLFNQFAGYKEVRLVPGRTDIAFVEFEAVEQASIAKQQLNSFKVTPTHAMKVTFAKK